MVRVTIDPRRRWRWDPDAAAYVEEKAPRRPPTASGPPASPDVVAELLTSMATSLAAPPAKDAPTSPAPPVAFPPRCPHCGGAPTTTRTLMTERAGDGGGAMFGSARPQVLALEVPSCARMPRPLSAYFLQIVLAFVTVVAGLAVLATPYAAVAAVASLAASLALWRARTWITLEPVAGDVIVLRVRDAAYAHGVARLSGGRVDGGRRLPPVSDDDALRAPLPPARAVRGADDR